MRRGYFDPAPNAPSATLPERLDAAMRGEDETSGVAASLSVTSAAHSVGAHLSFDVGRLPFAVAHGRRQQKLVVAAGLFRPDGSFVNGRQGELDLDLTPATYDRFRKQGLHANLDVAAAPGHYRLRVVVGEGSDGKIASFSRPVTVR